MGTISKNARVGNITPPTNTAPPKRYNQFHRGDKVLIQSREYTWGVIEHVWIRNKRITYRVRTYRKGASPKVLNKLPEDALIPFVKEWQYKVLKFFNIVM